MTTSIQKRRLALFAFFFIPGLSMASWVTRTPAIRDSLGVSIAEMGAVLFGLSVGSMTGILSAGALVGRFGTRRVMFIRHIPVSSAVHDGEGDYANASAAHVPVWKEPVVLLIGFIVLAMALAEGAANDWLPLLMVDEYGFSPTAGSMVFLGFATAMTVGRFGGGVLLNRYGRAAVVAASAITGAAGIAIVIFASHPALAAVAVVLWGLGASLGFPVALSAAGDSGPNGAARIKIVAIAGYVAFLVGPPLLGFVGEEYGLRNAMIVVLALVALATFCAPAIQRRGEAGKPVEA